MNDIMLDDVINTIASSPVLLAFAVAGLYPTLLRCVENVQQDMQQQIDDRETLSEMRALVYGEGW